MTSEEHSGLGARFASDLVGNSLAVIVLAGMLVSVVGAALAWQAKPATQKGNPAPANTWRWLIPLLCLVGMGVAGYLSYVETTQVEAVCGPVGDCNTVQQSEYARLFGILPIGILGIARLCADPARLGRSIALVRDSWLPTPAWPCWG